MKYLDGHPKRIESSSSACGEAAIRKSGCKEEDRLRLLWTALQTPAVPGWTRFTVLVNALPVHDALREISSRSSGLRLRRMRISKTRSASEAVQVFHLDHGLVCRFYSHYCPGRPGEREEARDSVPYPAGGVTPTDPLEMSASTAKNLNIEYDILRGICLQFLLACTNVTHQR
jgi:hypothetical protein